jgi:hypothetical protein
MTSEIINTLKEHAEHEPIVGYFGYGSLVNEDTLRTKYIASVPATLLNWQRMWDIPIGKNFDDLDISLLTSRPVEKSSTTGVIVFDRASNLPQVDERETNYDRHKLSLDGLHSPVDLSQISCDFYVYQAQKNFVNLDPRPPILQSYLDAVLQGFLRIYGNKGVEDFVNDTANFHTPILQDRDTPKYPRSVELKPEEQDLIDYILRSRTDISFIPLKQAI